jgi:hypothetical protein
MFSFSNIYVSDLLYNQPIFVAQFGQKRYVWFSKIFRAGDHRSGLVKLVEYHYLLH